MAALPNPAENIKQDDSLTIPVRVVVKEEGIWKSIRRLSNKNALLVATELEKDRLRFGEITKRTCLSVNDVNHALCNLKELGLITQSKDDKKYDLTQYCRLLLISLRFLNREIAKIREGE